jgi:hypothetical protein
MKTTSTLIPLFLLALLMAACSLFPFGGSFKLITPSDTVITEQRSASGFTGIDVSTFGNVILSQGDSESITIRGSDNLVPIIKTSVRNGVLVIETDENINVTGINRENVPTYTIMVKDLSSLMISGAAEAEMDRLTTSKLEITMSGAGQFVLDQLTAESVNILLSGLGNVEVSGEAATARVEISGAGSVKAGDLKLQTADVSISGLGGATLWVTDSLTGTISGGGDVSYYGAPRANTNTSGIGRFVSLGSK